ncbi:MULTISPECIES: hypothetical protein [unclassified Amycolatopsis]|uniref:hypothetical protein n=1 Tax=unclassified Amycolatopsis TaxID=2618356 RepID=UPI00106E2E84|nr:hypothetical protein [Amycolatopsis sp. CFH S0740]
MTDRWSSRFFRRFPRLFAGRRRGPREEKAAGFVGASPYPGQVKIQQSPTPSAAAGEAARRAFPGSLPSAGARFVRAADLVPAAFASALASVSEVRR